MSKKIVAVIALGLVALVAVFVWMSQQAQQGAQTAVKLGGAFELVDHNGRPFTQEELKGKYTLLYFGYTYCPDVCPTELQTIAEALKLLDKELVKDMRVVMVSIDPERDTPQVLKDYMGNFGPNFIGLTGTPEQVRKMAKQWRTFYRKAEDTADGGYLMDHSAIVFLLDKQGNYLRHFAYGTPPDRMAEGIREAVRGQAGAS